MSGVARNRKGKETRASILQAATDILLEGGYGNFVFRDVAKRAGVEPGNVQYYFGRKRDLLWAVLEPELEVYLGHLESDLKKGRTTREKIDRMVHYLFDDVSSERTLRLWTTIWAMAVEDPELFDVLSQWYRSYMDALSQLLQQVFPDLDPAHADEAATSVTAHFDGLLIVLQIGRPKTTTVDRMKQHIDKVITRIIDP